jgi:hypothetical protein
MSTDVLKVQGDYLIDASYGNITLDVTNSLTTGTVTIVGNLDVQGQVTNIESVNSLIKDNIITLNEGEVNNYVTAGTAGLLISRGNSDSPTQAATFLYNDAVSWSNLTTSTRGVFEVKSSNKVSALRTNAIRIDPSTAYVNGVNTSTLNFLGVENPFSVLSVGGTTNYELQVQDDDDIPNKKYVDQALYAGTDAAKRIQVGQTFVKIGDHTVSIVDPYYSLADKIYAALGTSTNVVFKLEGQQALIQGLTINNATIQVNTATDLVLQPLSGNAVAVSSPLKLQKQLTTSTSVANQSVIYYSGTAGGGGTGLYFVNTAQQDELVSRRKAIIYGIIF